MKAAKSKTKNGIKTKDIKVKLKPGVSFDKLVSATLGKTIVRDAKSQKGPLH